MTVTIPQGSTGPKTYTATRELWSKPDDFVITLADEKFYHYFNLKTTQLERGHPYLTENFIYKMTVINTFV